MSMVLAAAKDMSPVVSSMSMAAARAKPGELSVGGAPASSLQVAYEVLKRAAKVEELLKKQAKKAGIDY